MHRACIASSSYANFCFYCLPHLHFLMRTSLQFPVHCSPPRVMFLQRVPRSCRLLIVVNSPVCGDLCCFAKRATMLYTGKESQLIIVTTPTHSRAQCALCSFFSSKCYIVIHRELLIVVNWAHSSFQCSPVCAVRIWHILHCCLCLSAKCHEVVHREGVVVQPLVVYNCHHDIFESPVCHKMCSKYANQYVLVQCTMCTDLQPCCWRFYKQSTIATNLILVQ